MAGAPEDLRVFVERQRPRLVAILTLHCGDQLLAEELANEALIRLCSRWEEVREKDQPGAWVRRVALNLAASWFRRVAAERRALRRVGGRPAAAVEADPGEALAIRDALRQLPSRRRAVLVLRYYDDLSVEETAAVMEISASAVTSLTSRAVAELRAAIADAPDSDDGEVLRAY